MAETANQPKKISVLVCDDEKNIRSVLVKMVNRVPGFEVVGEAEDGEKALRIFDALLPKVVFLDVDMPGMTGVELAREIQDREPETILIFATGHEQYRGDAFEVYAFDYLLKPFDLVRVQETLLRISRLQEKTEPLLKAPEMERKPFEPPRLMLRHREGVSFLDQEDILLIQREDRATVIYTRDEGRYVVAETLGELEARLDKDTFMRCHKSYIVNIRHIRDITPYGRWTYVVRFNGSRRDALITSEKFEELQKRFG